MRAITARTAVNGKLGFNLLGGAMKKEKTIITMDLKELHDAVWKEMYKQEGKERRKIGMGPYIVNYLLRPLMEKKEG